MYNRAEPGEQATDMRATVVGPERAEGILKRHQDLNRAPQIVRAILAFARGKVGPFHEIREKVGRDGAFVMEYDLAKVQQRLQDGGGWVVAEASAMVTRKVQGALQTTAALPWADCQCAIPEDRKGVPLHEEINLPRPELGDHVFAKGAVRQIQEVPACAGCVADLGAHDHAAHLGLAALARDTAFQRIMRLDRKYPIRFMTAEIFSIRGLLLPDGTAVYPSVSITNFASILMHEHSRRYPASLGWVLNERTVPVYLEKDKPGNPHYLIADWFVMVYDFDFIRKSVPRPDREVVARP